MKIYTHDEVNRLLRTHVTSERLYFGWKGTILDFLEYTDLPMDARVDTALCLVGDNSPVLRAFAAWCIGELAGFTDYSYKSRVDQYAKEWRSKLAVNRLASYMRAAYFEESLWKTNRPEKALSAMIGAGGAQLIALYSIVRQNQNLQN